MLWSPEGVILSKTILPFCGREAASAFSVVDSTKSFRQ
jgi:hypothetical protein